MDNEQAMNKVLDGLKAGEPDPSVFVAGTGVRLRIKKVSQMIIADAKRRIPVPQIPKWFNPDKEREEENPNDPAYLTAVNNYNWDTAMLAMRVYMILGTEIIEPLPPNVLPPESTKWSDMIFAADPDADIPADGPRRYFAWLKYHAFDDEDQTRILQAVVRMSGQVSEDDVRVAQDSFRGQSTRDTAPRMGAAAEDQSRDRNGNDPGFGTGVRSEGGGGLHALPVGRLDGEIELV